MPDLALADTDFQPGNFDFAGARVGLHLCLILWGQCKLVCPADSVPAILICSRILESCGFALFPGALKATFSSTTSEVNTFVETVLCCRTNSFFDSAPAT